MKLIPAPTTRHHLYMGKRRRRVSEIAWANELQLFIVARSRFLNIQFRASLAHSAINRAQTPSQREQAMMSWANVKNFAICERERSSKWRLNDSVEQFIAAKVIRLTQPREIYALLRTETLHFWHRNDTIAREFWTSSDLRLRHQTSRDPLEISAMLRSQFLRILFALHKRESATN